MEKIDIVKSAQYDLLMELKRICDQFNIKYFLVGGSLIGAIRHNGFIPWDDDIDVGMIRDEYEKFIDVCKNNLNNNYSLIDWKSDINSPLPFIKLKINNTTYIEDISKDSKMNNSIFIDIFPFDKIPKNKFLQKNQKYKIFLLRKIIMIKCGFKLGRGKKIRELMYVPLRIISIFLTKNSWKNIFEKSATKYNSLNNYTCYTNLCGSYSYEKETVCKEILEEYIECKFENHNFMIPKSYDDYLHHVYGDYMKLPPEEQRYGRHQVSKVDLNDYKVNNKIYYKKK